MISDAIYNLCRCDETISSELAAQPEEAPSVIKERLFGREHSSPVQIDETQAKYDTERAFECGKWGTTRPSELFLKIYSDVLCTLDKNHPLAGVTSPPQMGTCGVCPLTVISTVPDICRHMSNLIARAEHEVFLATNYWKYSEGSRLLSNSIRELSRRSQGKNRKIVVKVMYDRGDLMQLVNNHQSVPPKYYSNKDGPIQLPSPEEIPNIEMEIVNFHRPPLGTFHSKFMIVDRRIAILQSNNIQDNDNLEMMNQFEGPIVDSLYDMALISWHNVLKPPLPCLNQPAVNSPTPTFATESYKAMFEKEGRVRENYTSMSSGIQDGSDLQDVAAHGSKVDLPPHTSEDPHYDDDIATEVLRAISGFTPRNGKPLIQGVTDLLNLPVQSGTEATAPDIGPLEMMTPMIPIPPHEVFPIAMVCREPYGPPTKASLHTPQNAAFTSALRNATKTAFIQTPNLNASDLLPEILAACRRGIQVTYFYCLGYNDSGELLPGQGGHNEGVANRLYNELEEEYHENLNIYTYVAKDQIHPIHNKFKKRSCHIKLMIVDDHIGIQGSGNQDTQSWYHSQEVNVMIDSQLVCGKWLEGIRQNQNTHKYGQVGKTGVDAGCWKDPQTEMQADGAIGVEPGRFSWLKGFEGAIQRVRGTGGF